MNLALIVSRALLVTQLARDTDFPPAYVLSLLPEDEHTPHVRKLLKL